MPKGANILAVLALALLPALARGQATARTDGKIVRGSKADQMLLREAIDKQLSGSLVAELNENKKVWGAMTAEQLRELRQRYYAFLRESDADKARLLETEIEFNKLSDEQKQSFRRRAAWLTKVVASLTPDERRRLQEMSPEDRAKRLLELKSRLAETQPVDPPASPPAT